MIFQSPMVFDREVCFPQFCSPSTLMRLIGGDLSTLGVGCYWDSLFAGTMCYADDLALLAPSPSSLRLMLHCCEEFHVIVV